MILPWEKVRKIETVGEVANTKINNQKILAQLINARFYLFFILKTLHLLIVVKTIQPVSRFNYEQVE